MERRLLALLPDGVFANRSAVNSHRMRAIRARGNQSTERRLRAYLAQGRIKGWKMHPGGVLGKPDFYFPRQKVAVFVDGCFWHGCPVCSHPPRQNRLYWIAKIDGNRQRDKRHQQALVRAGVRVLRFWEHELTDNATECVHRIRAVLRE